MQHITMKFVMCKLCHLLKQTSKAVKVTKCQESKNSKFFVTEFQAEELV